MPFSWPALSRPYAPAAPPEASRAAIGSAQHSASRLLHKAHVDTAIGVSMHMNDGMTRIKSLVPLGVAVRLQAVRWRPDSVGSREPVLLLARSQERAGLCVGDVVHTINGQEVDSATFGCTLLASAPAGFVEIVVSTSAPPSSPVAPAAPVALPPAFSDYDDEIELLPAKSISALPAYDDKVRELEQMGFADEHAARCALRASNGDVHAAVERLLAGSPES